MVCWFCVFIIDFDYVECIVGCIWCVFINKCGNIMIRRIVMCI